MAPVITMTTTRVVIVPPTGPVQVQDWTGDTLPHLQQAVGGLVDVVTIHDIDVWLNDTGLYTEEVNQPITTWIVDQIGHFWQTFHGTAVLAASNEHGVTVSLPDDCTRDLVRTFSQCPVPLCDAEPGLPCQPECLWNGPQVRTTRRAD